MYLETVPFCINVAKDGQVWHLDDSQICVITGLCANREIARPEGGSLAKIALIIKFRFTRASIDWIGFGLWDIFNKMGVEVVEVNLGILDLITGLVDGVRS